MNKSDNITVGEKLRLIDGPYKGRIFTVIAEDLKDQRLHGRLYCCSESDVKYGHIYTNRREEIQFKQSNHGNPNHAYWIEFSSFERVEALSKSMEKGMLLSELQEGDVVEILDTPNVRNYNAKNHIGARLTISANDVKSNPIAVVFPENNKYATIFYDGDFKLVSRKSPVSKGVPLSDLKEGDRVEVLDTENVKFYICNGRDPIGKVLVISKEDVERYTSHGNMIPEKNRLATTFRDGDFKILSRRDSPISPKSSLKYKFKVGDKVRVINIGWGTADLYAETTIVEQGEYSGEPAYKVDHPKIGNSLTGFNKGMIGEKTFELVEEEEEEEEVKKSPLKIPKFQVGDVVRVVANGNGIGTLDIGKEVTICAIGKDYNDQVGYKISPPLGNCISGVFGGVVGEKSFVLVKSRDYLMEERKYEDEYRIRSIKYSEYVDKAITKSKEDKYFQEPIKVVKSKTIKQLKLV